MFDLNKVYDELLKGTRTSGDVASIIKDYAIQSRINMLINKPSINKLIPYSEEDIQFINMVVNITQFIYNNSGIDTGISDETYDLLYAILLSNGGSDIVSAPIAPSHKNIAYHKYPSLRGTLKKIFYLSNDEERKNPSRRYLDEWKSSMENKIYQETGRVINLDNEEIYVFPKWDGVSGIFEMNEKNEIDRVLTRGDTTVNEAQDITSTFSRWFQREYQELKGKAYGLKTEIMMTEKDLEWCNHRYGTDYKNSRSIVAGILTDDDYIPDKVHCLHVVPLRIGYADGTQELATEALTKYPHIRCRLKDREVIRKFALEHKYVNGLRCDGAVIHIINPEIQKILGRENDINNFEVAYKFTEEDAKTVLKGVDFQIGLFGRIAPVARVKPVKLKGNTISSVSLGSMGRFMSMDLHEGDEVKILYDIIPYLVQDKDCVKNYDGKRIEVPEYCPACGSRLSSSDSGDIFYCSNPYCPCREKGKILNYLDKMNIDNLSYGTIDKLFEAGIVKNIQDLYSLKNHKNEIISIDGFGKQKYNLWITSIENQMEQFDATVLGALGIEGVSKKIFGKILSIYTIDELMDLIESNKGYKLNNITGLQDKTTSKIIKGLMENKELIKFLQKKLIILDTKSSTGKSKFSVCFTKIRDPEMEKLIMGLGGTVVDSVTKDTNFVVVPSLNTDSSKVQKARKYQIPLIVIDDLEAYLSQFK